MGLTAEPEPGPAESVARNDLAAEPALVLVVAVTCALQGELPESTELECSKHGTCHSQPPNDGVGVIRKYTIFAQLLSQHSMLPAEGAARHD